MTADAEVYFLDVRQAHATVITAGSSGVLVVDCPLSGAVRAEEIISETSSERLDIVVTHRDLDHCGGIAKLVRRFANEESRIYMNPAFAISAAQSDFPLVRTVLKGIISASQETGAEMKGAVRGDQSSLGPLSWEVKSPAHVDVMNSAVGGSVNRSSIVLRVDVASRTFLIPGDLDDVGISNIIKAGEDLSAHVVLLPHHGARLSRIEELLTAVDPDYAIVSAGRRMTHPAKETLDAASLHGCILMCTQVSRHCEPADMIDPACAGEIVFSVGASGHLEVSPDRDRHREVIVTLTSAVCEPKSGHTASSS